MRMLVSLIAAAALLVAPPAFGWSWPVAGPVLTPFSVGPDPYAAGQHRGIDIGAPTGTPVAAPAAGAVSFAGTVPRGGKTLTIRTPDGYSVTLVHLGSYSLRRGDAVEEGQIVGTVGPSGVPELAQPYVYLGVRVTTDPNGYVDPLRLLPSAEPAPTDPPAPPDNPPVPGPPDDSKAPPVTRAGVAPPAPVAPPPPAVVPTSTAVPLPPRTRAVSGPVATGGRTGSASRSTVDTAQERAARAPGMSAQAVDRAGNGPRALRRPTATTRRAAPMPSGARPSASPAVPRVLRAAAEPRPHGGLDTAVPPTVAGHSTGVGPPVLPFALLLGAGAALLLALLGRRRRSAASAAGKAARIIAGDALLLDDTHLLRELDPPHRACVHDDRGPRARPAPSAARGRDVLPHGHRRARFEGVPRRRGAGSRPEGIRGPDRRRLARAA